MEGINPGAMSRLSRLGNPLLSGFLNLLYLPRRTTHTAACALFAGMFWRQLDLQSTGMEFASEMVI